MKNKILLFILGFFFFLNIIKTNAITYGGQPIQQQSQSNNTQYISITNSKENYLLILIIIAIIISIIYLIVRILQHIINKGYILHFLLIIISLLLVLILVQLKNNSIEKQFENMINTNGNSSKKNNNIIENLLNKL